MGQDTLTGGGRADYFTFGSTAVSAVGNADLITDFTQLTDKIDLHSIDANTTSGATGDQAFTLPVGNAFTHNAGELIYTQSGSQTHIFGDTDADGVANFQIDLTGTLTLTASDFIL